MTQGTGAPRAHPDVACWAIGAALVAYVALCTGQRDHAIFADAWEHDRAIRALASNLTAPGNPTYALDIPSIRYSPYTVTLAVISRATGIDPWHVLSGAAAATTALLVVGIRAFLGALGRADAAPAALVVMVSLWGKAPAYASSNALADLPWNQVNPSAPALALSLLTWTVLLRSSTRPGTPVASIGTAALLGGMIAVTLLDHAMTGAVAVLGLGAVAVFGVPADRRARSAALACAAVVVATALCLCWPWFSFRAAVGLHPDPDYWFNPNMLRRMFTKWLPPALLLSVAALTSPDRRTVRLLLVAAASAVALGLAATLVRSPTLARIPLAGVLFAHLAVGILVAESGLLRPGTWSARLRALRRPLGREARRPLLETAVALALVACLAPQVVTIVRKPWLAREFVAPLVGAPSAGPSIRDDLVVLLEPVGERDTVLSDVLTSWAVPSARGRIVAAMHYEFFVPGQKERAADVTRFFGAGTDASTDASTSDDRRDVIARYGVRWLVVDEMRTSPDALAGLVRDAAVVGRQGRFVLMDAARWVQSGR